MTNELSSDHIVAVIGGAVAGAQVARILADGGASVVVFEQNDRPFGKIEDGLPRWHSALRRKEFERIQDTLTHDRIHFLPQTKIGDFVSFGDLVKKWGFSAVVLANGVWRDRPLPVPDGDKWLGKGLIYQNPFIVAFNHQNDPNYSGPTFDIPDGALVVGGGLASIDVVKVLMLETTRAKLKERGHEVDLEEMEKAGIPKTCETAGVKFEDLGIQGATLIYRRRAEDMPVAEAPEGATPERMAKVQASRKKILDRAMSKFLFRFEPLSSPEEAIVENDRLVGLKLRRMAPSEGRKLVKTDEVFELRGSAVLSSIGSIPEPIPDVDMKGELFAFTDWEFGRLEAFPTVFSAGNVVTGKGNIVASRRHSTMVGEHVASAYLGLTSAEDLDITEPMRAVSTEEAEKIAEQISKVEPPQPETKKAILDKIRSRQSEIGYGGDLRAWIQAHPPAE